MKKLALFDIDGVIYDGHSIFDLIQDQEKTGFIKTRLWNKFLELLSDYKSGLKKYKETADKMLQEYAKSLEGKNYKEILDYNSDFIIRNKNKIFPHFSKLVSRLVVSHDVYLVTTNFDFTAEVFTRYFDLTGFLSSKIQLNEGVVTGGVEISLGGNKGLVAELLNRYGKSGSIAVGDSENDADMLELVEYPFVMEPNSKLKEIASEKKWKVVNRSTITDIIISHVK